MPGKKIIPFSPRRFPPKGLNLKMISKVLAKANDSLAQYAEELSEVPCARFLLQSLFVLESIDSLSSQKIRTTLKEVMHSIAFHSDKKLHPIVFHFQALKWSCDGRTSINKKWICTLHEKIKKGSRSKKQIAMYRKRQNWIGPAGCKIEEAYFYPPAPPLVDKMMRELFRYLRGNENEPLLQLAIVFAQFLIIHPYMDGNGRIARILIPLFLYQKKMIPIPFFFMSRYFRQHRFRYFLNLYQTTIDDEWNNWILFFLKGVHLQAQRMRRLILEIKNLYENLQRERILRLHKKTLLFIFRAPVFSLSSFLQAKGSRSVLRILLQRKWVIKENDVFVFAPLLIILSKK